VEEMVTLKKTEPVTWLAWGTFRRSGLGGFVGKICHKRRVKFNEWKIWTKGTEWTARIKIKKLRRKRKQQKNVRRKG